MALVYSTEQGRLCPTCGLTKKGCQCKPLTEIAPSDGWVRVSRETKGRKGKGVTLVSGLALTDRELKELAKKLKAHCGTGGTVKNGLIEIQGDHRDRLLQMLKILGYSVKKAGG